MFASIRYRPAQQGLTLVEVLVTVFILLLVLGLSYQGLSTLLAVRERVPEDIRQWNDIERVFDRIEYDFTNLSWVAPVSAGGKTLYPLIVDPDGKIQTFAPLTLSRFSTGTYAGEDGQVVGYRLTDDQLEMLVWPTPYLPLTGKASEPKVYPILSGVQSFSVEVMETVNSGWVKQYPAINNADNALTQSPVGNNDLEKKPVKPAQAITPLPVAIRVSLSHRKVNAEIQRIFSREY